MKIILGSGVYMEPDEGPRDTVYHKKIVRIEPIPGRPAAHNVTLECGHGVEASGDLAHAKGVIFCLKCRDFDEAEARPRQGAESEIGRELKVSQLVEHTVVCVWKSPAPVVVTMWVVEIGDTWVHFRAGEIGLEFLARRCGPDLEQITDDAGAVMKVFEYLGKYDALPG